MANNASSVAVEAVQYSRNMGIQGECVVSGSIANVAIQSNAVQTFGAGFVSTSSNASTKEQLHSLADSIGTFKTDFLVWMTARLANVNTAADDELFMEEKDD
mmetsp:Transcript_6468/g.10050  ORF Transcript_6468/g.10050 Transcript_6468/m.10050 type:complete len:102 (+) Transcript_6468:19-324(+)